LIFLNIGWASAIAKKPLRKFRAEALSLRGFVLLIVFLIDAALQKICFGGCWEEEPTEQPTESLAGAIQVLVKGLAG